MLVHVGIKKHHWKLQKISSDRNLLKPETIFKLTLRQRTAVLAHTTTAYIKDINQLGVTKQGLGYVKL